MMLLVVESRDFPQAEKKRTAYKAEQINTQNDNLGPLSVCEFSQLCKELFLSQMEKSHVTYPQQPKTRGHVEHLYLQLWACFVNLRGLAHQFCRTE